MQTLSIISKKQKKRFRGFIEKKHPKGFQMEVWLLKSEEKFEEAIKILEKKEKEEGITDLHKKIVINEKASCLVEWILNEKTAPPMIRDRLKDVEDVISEIMDRDEKKLDCVYKLIPEDEDTKKLKVRFGKFIGKLQKIEPIIQSLYSELLKEIKLVLDRTIHYLYMVARQDGDPNQNTCYPSISEFRNKTNDEECLESIVKKLKGIFWKGTRKVESIDLLEKIPQLKELNRYFVFAKYPWYDQLIEIRNPASHKPSQVVGNIVESNLDDILENVIKATLYAACVFRFVKTIQTELTPRICS